MTIIFQGNEREALSNVFTTGGSANDVAGRFDAAYSNAACEIVTPAYIEVDAGSGLSPIFCSSAYHVFGSGGNTNPGTAETIKWLDSSAVGWLRMRMPTTSGIIVIELWNGSTWNVIATSVGTSAASGQWAAVITGIGTTNGTITLWRSGVQMAEALAQDFSAFADLRYIRYSSMGQAGTRTGWTEHQIADTSLVNHRLKTVVATSGGTDNTDGTGAYTTIDESTQNGSTMDTDYIEFTAAGQKRSFKGAARTLAQPSYKGVTVTGRLMRVDATGPQKAKPYLLISGTRYYGTTFNLTTSFANYQYTWLTNPATSSPWTASDVNSANLEWGWETVA